MTTQAAFDYFVVLADMRTGSNFLESNLNALPDITCHGEVFNPAFVGYPRQEHLFDFDLQRRNEDPIDLIRAIAAPDGPIRGFRYFPDHDPRVLPVCLADPRCAKIMLTRNPLHSFVSLKTAQMTGQWKLTDAKFQLDELPHLQIDTDELRLYLTEKQRQQSELATALKASGHSVFRLTYDDLQNRDVLNGLAAFIGSQHRLERTTTHLKRQNTAALADRIDNLDEVEQCLADQELFDLYSELHLETPRGPAVARYLAAPSHGLLFAPLRNGLDATVKTWLTGLENGPLERDFNRKTFRHWCRQHPSFRSFVVAQHPLPRAFETFKRRVLIPGPDTYSEIRKTLRGTYRLPLPAGAPGPGFDTGQLHAAFLAFLRFLKLNLAGQTSVRQDQEWSSQGQHLRGIASFQSPKIVLTEDSLASGLPFLVGQTQGITAPAFPQHAELAKILSNDLQAAARQAYPRDYEIFGFGDWRPD